MPVFHKSAYLAAWGDKPREALEQLTDEHFDSEEALDEALGWLCDEQRCDALYGDWLLQLNSPSGPALLAVRDLLIGQGAIDANYLAELAQNADDASDGLPAEVRVVNEGEWLIFANNGRKVTSANLRGLSRFFCHGEAITRETIGKFGIGFKSCYRIALEVFVQTWEGSHSFAFRIPISRTRESASHPDAQRLSRLCKRLEKLGERIPQGVLRAEKLGYCTPEFVDRLPRAAESLLRPLRDPSRGTAFCLHLHDDGQKEVARRITGQSREVYELCPLFLPNLKSVTVQNNSLRMLEGRNLQADAVTGVVSARRVTLETGSSQSTSNDRFWRVRGEGPDDRWAVALHADSEFRLSTAKQTQPDIGLKEGAAYAFFPLGDVVWPIRLHLHVDLPTTLSRGSWNVDVEGQVRRQIKSAAQGLAAWLEAFPQRWLATWSLESLFHRQPIANDGWAFHFYRELIESAKTHRIIGSVWGTATTASDARTVTLIGNPRFRESWVALSNHLPNQHRQAAIVLETEKIDIGIPALNGDQLRGFFADVLETAGDDWECHKIALRSALGVNDAAPQVLQAILARIRVRRANQSVASVRDLMMAPGGADLADGWHDVFRELATWLPRERRAISIFGASLGHHLDRLSHATFSLEWEDVPTAMATDEEWERNGDRFWSEPRTVCPQNLRKKVIQVLRAKDGRGKWIPLVRVWLLDSNPVNCFHGLIERWDLGSDINSRRQTQALDLISQWGLRSDYEDSIEQKLLADLGGSILSALERLPENPMALLSSSAHTTSRNNLATRWKRIVVGAEDDAAVEFLSSRLEAQQDRVFLHTDISWSLRHVVEWLPAFHEAPRWLSQDTVDVIASRSLLARLPFKILTARDLTVQQKMDLGKQLLGAFHQWRDRTISEAEAMVLNDLFARATGNWEVRLSSGHPKYLRNLIAVPPNPTPELRAVMDHSGSLEWHGTDRLPEQLQTIEPLAQACLSLDKLKLAVEARPRPQEIDKDAVSSSLLDNPGFLSLEATRQDWQLLYADHLSIVWKHQEQKVCEIRDALFAFDGNKLYVSDRSTDEPHPGEQGYSDVLAVYLTFSNDAEVRRAREEAVKSNRSLRSVYMKYRVRVVGALRQKLVTDIGYAERHIVRELLQNAESAYASRSGDKVTHSQPFRVVVTESRDSDKACVEVRHNGRCFNETDCEGKTRDDVHDIVSLGFDPTKRTAEEVGRFNRGFKSVFNVTSLVEVISGGYVFAIEDLLLLQPGNPLPDSARHSGETKFRFECSRQEISKLLGYRAGNPSGQRVGVLSAATFPFLRHVSEVSVKRDKEDWAWQITRQALDEGWQQCTIAQGGEPPEVFLVWHDQADLRIGGKPRRIGIAVRADNQGIPLPLEKGWNRLYLTFPCEDEGPCGVLINADFDTDQGRIGVRFNDTNAILIKSALSACADLMDSQLTASPSRKSWLAWADTWQVRSAKAWIEGHYEVDNAHLADIFDRARGILLARVPLKNRTQGADNFVYPSRLMRTLARQYEDDWRIDRNLWIDVDVETRLRDLGFERNRFGLADLVLAHVSDKTLLGAMHQVISSAPFAAKYGISVIETQEIEAALHRLERVLQPPLPPIPDMLPADEGMTPWSVENLFEWWAKNQDTDPYTLDGSWWPLLSGEESCPKKERASRLKGLLSDRCSNETDLTDEGRLAWYKVLSIACLMSTGRRVTQIQAFWKDRLDQMRFWEHTAGRDFGDAARACFEGAIRSQLRGENASGEDADFWRRVFYDIRKVHHLIYANSFAETVMDLASREDLAPQLLLFMRNGSLPNQPTWCGVLGQSAGSPLFFVVRELRRLKVIETSSVDSSSFFVCKPVRRAAYRMGWIDAALMTRYDFASLSEISAILHEKYCSDNDCGKKLLRWFDIPLLHYAQTEIGS